MKTKSSLGSSIFLAAILAGCATQGQNSGGQGPSAEDLGKLQAGRTTTAEVKALLGPPLRVTRFERMERDVWEYRRYVDPTSEYLVAVQFSADGVVREVLQVKDYTREPCGI